MVRITDLSKNLRLKVDPNTSFQDVSSQSVIVYIIAGGIAQRGQDSNECNDFRLLAL